MAKKTETAPAEKIVKPTKAMLARYMELKAKKKAADAESRRCEEELKTVGAVLYSYAEANENEVVTCGFSLRLVEGGRYPSWKTVVEKELGTDFALGVIESTPPKTVLEVEPV